MKDDEQQNASVWTAEGTEREGTLCVMWPVHPSAAGSLNAHVRNTFTICYRHQLRDMVHKETVMSL